MNKDTKIPVDYHDYGNFTAEWADCIEFIKDYDELYIVSFDYIKEKEEMRRLMREMLIDLDKVGWYYMPSFKDSMNLLGLKMEDLN